MSGALVSRIDALELGLRLKRDDLGGLDGVRPLDDRGSIVETPQEIAREISPNAPLISGEVKTIAIFKVNHLLTQDRGNSTERHDAYSHAETTRQPLIKARGAALIQISMCRLTDINSPDVSPCFVMAKASGAAVSPLATLQALE
jgi:hypothetical protein